MLTLFLFELNKLAEIQLIWFRWLVDWGMILYASRSAHHETNIKKIMIFLKFGKVWDN